MRRLATVGWGLTASALVFEAMASLPVGWPRPEPFLVLVVACAVRWGSAWGGLVGAGAGVLEAALAPGPAGGYLLLLTGLGWVVGMARHETGQGPLLLLLLTAAATVALGLGWSGLALWSTSEPAPERLRAWLPGAVVLNLFLILPFMNWLRARERRRR